jgi:hypothetical protein
LEESIETNYHVYRAYIIQSFIYPYKKFTFATNFGIASNFYQLTSTVTTDIYSIQHPIYHSYSSNLSSNYENKYSGSSLSYMTSLSISYQLMNNISIFGNVGYTWSDIEFQKGLRMYYYLESSNSFGGVESVSQSEPEEIESEYIRFGKIDYNSWNFKLGLRYTFKK